MRKSREKIVFLIVNSVWATPGAGVKRRLVYVDHANGVAVLMPLVIGALPDVVRVTRLTEEINQRRLVRVADPFESKPAHSLKPGSKAELKRNRNHLLILALKEFEPDIFYRGPRHLALATVADKFNVSRQTLMSLLRKWWIGGQVLAAISAKKRKANQTTPGAGAARGAKARYEDRDNYLSSSLDKRIMSLCLRRYFLRNKKMSLPKTFDKMVAKFYSFLDDNGVLTPLPAGQRPTLRQLRTFLETHFTYAQVRLARVGATELKLTERPTLSSAIQDCAGPGHYFELDATVDNTHLVAAHDRSIRIGRATVYFIRDRYSRFIVAAWVTLDPPSWSGAMNALVAISEDKEDYCLKHGIVYIAADWPCVGYPQFICVDRGEGIAKSSDQLINALNIFVVSLPPFRADFKGVIENSHKLKQVIIQAETPGYKVPRFNLRGPKNHDENGAALTRKEFTTVIAQTVHRLNTSRISGYPLTTEMITDGVKPIPAEIFHWGLIHHSGKLRSLAPGHVRDQLLPRSEARVTESGFKFKGCFYTSDRAKREGWFLRAVRGTWKVPVSYDPNLVNEIVMRDSANGTCETLTLLDECDSFRGWSFAEVHSNRVEKRLLEAGADSESLKSAVRYLQNTEPLFKLAVQEKKSAVLAAETRSKEEKKFLAKAALKAEKQLQHGEDAQRNVPRVSLKIVHPTRVEGAGTITPVELVAAPAASPSLSGVQEAVRRNHERLINGTLLDEK